MATPVCFVPMKCATEISKVELMGNHVPSYQASLAVPPLQTRISNALALPTRQVTVHPELRNSPRTTNPASNSSRAPLNLSSAAKAFSALATTLPPSHFKLAVGISTVLLEVMTKSNVSWLHPATPLKGRSNDPSGHLLMNESNETGGKKFRAPELEDATPENAPRDLTPSDTQDLIDKLGAAGLEMEKNLDEALGSIDPSGLSPERAAEREALLTKRRKNREHGDTSERAFDRTLNDADPSKLRPEMSAAVEQLLEVLNKNSGKE